MGPSLVQPSNMVGHLARWQVSLGTAVSLDVIEQTGVATFLKQADGSLECDESLKLAHVNAVAVWVHDRRRGACDDDACRIEPREDCHNRLAKRCATNNRIIDDDKSVFVCHDVVGDVVDVSDEIAASGVVCNEGP